MSKNKIMDMVLMAASMLLAVVKIIVEQEKPKEDNDETSQFPNKGLPAEEALCLSSWTRMKPRTSIQ